MTQLPIRTTLDDIINLCKYFAKKPTGSTIKEAKTVLDKKVLDPRKVNALKFWGFLVEIDGEKFKITERGRGVTKNNEPMKQDSLRQALCALKPYAAVIERVSHRGEQALTSLDVAAHWHEHFKGDVSDKDKIINDQAVCFFRLAEGAGLGTTVVGRKGLPTRFEFLLDEVTSLCDSKMIVDDVSLDHEEDEYGNDLAASTIEIKEDKTAKNVTVKRTKGIFIAHGKKKKPVEQLQKVLGQFKIPYKVAVDEPNLGRPIGTKIKEIMNTCNCAILIFTKDEEYFDKDGNSKWRPSQNVIHELGAASYLYDDRIVIMKEDNVELASNFADLGYIPFDADNLEASAMQILKELIGFELVKIST